MVVTYTCILAEMVFEENYFTVSLITRSMLYIKKNRQ